MKHTDPPRNRAGYGFWAQRWRRTAGEDGSLRSLPGVSAIVPAHNAASTLDETLTSLLAQTCSQWEAIVVDDGSTDDTAGVALRWAAYDGRVHVLRQTRCGVSVARNAGINAAQSDWLLFLDADDWVAPHYLERMTQALASDPALDAVRCGWVPVMPGGRHSPPEFGAPLDDLFVAAGARGCPFAIHACVLRRSLVEAVGGFDADLATAEDWDLWQRVIRAGARIGAVSEALAFYRIQPAASGAAAPDRVLKDGMTVIRRGHAPDPRVPAPRPQYAKGLPAEDLPAALFGFVSWPAGLALGQGQDACRLLQSLRHERAPTLAPCDVAGVLFEAISLSARLTPEEWPEFWPSVESRLGTYLEALEKRSDAPGLARRACHQLERRILQSASLDRPLTLGVSHGIRVDAAQEISDVAVGNGVERLFCVIEFAGQELGAIELPVFGGAVAREEIARAISGAVAWRLVVHRLRSDRRRDLRPWLRLFKQLLGRRSLRLTPRRHGPRPERPASVPQNDRKQGARQPPFGL